MDGKPDHVKKQRLVEHCCWKQRGDRDDQARDDRIGPETHGGRGERSPCRLLGHLGKAPQRQRGPHAADKSQKIPRRDVQTVEAPEYPPRGRTGKQQRIGPTPIDRRRYVWVLRHPAAKLAQTQAGDGQDGELQPLAPRIVPKTHRGHVEPLVGATQHTENAQPLPRRRRLVVPRQIRTNTAQRQQSETIDKVHVVHLLQDKSSHSNHLRRQAGASETIRNHARASVIF